MDGRAAIALIGGGVALALMKMKGETVNTSKYSEQHLVLARTIYGEARGEGEQGMQAVANVVMNRVHTDLWNDNKPDWWGEGVIEVCKKRWQFSAWNPGDPNLAKIQNLQPGANAVFDLALLIAVKAIMGTLPDLTGGATQYHTTSTTASWASSMTVSNVIGNHIFYT